MKLPAETKHEAVLMVAMGKSQSAIARELGINRGTVREWLGQPEFQARVSIAATQAVRLANEQLKGIYSKAVTKLGALVDSEDDSIAIRACSTVVNSVLKATELAHGQEHDLTREEVEAEMRRLKRELLSKTVKDDQRVIDVRMERDDSSPETQSDGEMDGDAGDDGDAGRMGRDNGDAGTHDPPLSPLLPSRRQEALSSTSKPVDWRRHLDPGYVPPPPDTSWREPKGGIILTEPEEDGGEGGDV